MPKKNCSKEDLQANIGCFQIICIQYLYIQWAQFGTTVNRVKRCKQNAILDLFNTFLMRHLATSNYFHSLPCLKPKILHHPSDLAFGTTLVMVLGLSLKVSTCCNENILTICKWNKVVKQLEPVKKRGHTCDKLYPDH